MTTFDMAALLFLLAAVTGIVNARTLRLPRAIALLLGALAVSLAIIAINPFLAPFDLREVSRHRILAANLPRVLLDGVLALLLFAGSLHVDLRALRSQAWAVFGLATSGVIVATVLFALGIRGVFLLAGEAVPLPWCFVLGAILAPTDAVAVEGLLRRVALPAHLKAIISGESLFNDGAAVVIFLVALATAQGATGLVGHGHIALALLIEGGGGAVLGWVTGWLAGIAMRHADDAGLALTISLALVLTTYRLAVAFHLSGPIAVVVAGLALGNLRQRAQAEASYRALVAFWSLIDDLLNTLLYMLIGFELLAVTFGAGALLPVLIAIPLALAARLLSVCGPMLVLNLRLRDRDRGRGIAVLTWAGLRGGVSVALALILPAAPFRDLLLMICYAVVIFTIVVQGLSMPRVIAALYGRSGVGPAALPESPGR